MEDNIGDLVAGQILKERYQIVRKLKSGSLAQTYVATDLKHPHQGQCIVKEYSSSGAVLHLDKTKMRLFLREAKHLQVVGIHPHIPRFVDYFGIKEQGWYIVQECIEGTSLQDLLPFSRYSNDCWDFAAAWDLLKQMLEVLDFVHGHGIIHGDIKPNNIIQRNQDRRFWLIDFGGSRSLPEQETTTFTNESKEEVGGDLLGSPSAYTAPEQFSGQCSPASDLYSLGLIVIHALTGLEPNRIPRQDGHGEFNWRSLLSQVPQNPKAQRLLRVMDRMIRQNPEARYPSVRALVKDLIPNANVTKGEQTMPSSAPEMPLTSSPQNPEIAHTKATEHGSRNGKGPNVVIFPVDDWPGFGLGVPQNSTAVDKTLPTLLSPSDSLAVLTESQGMVEAWPSLPEEESGLPAKRFKPPGFLAGLGITVLFVNAVLIALGVQSIFRSSQAEDSIAKLLEAYDMYEGGDLEQAIALAQNIPSQSPAHESAQELMTRWQKEWHDGKTQLDQINVAAQKQEWATVLEQAKQLPSGCVWGKKSAPLVAKAQQALEVEGRQLLQQAYTQAQGGNFGAALLALKQIHPDTSLGAVVKGKLSEYLQKQQMRARYDLQQAVNAAERFDFAKAIGYLKNIPPDSTYGDLARTKIKEYEQKLQIRRQQGLVSYRSTFPNPGMKWSAHPNTRSI